MSTVKEINRRETVTPQKAAEWLALNTNNRPVSQPVVAEYTKSMQQGKWDYTGESVKFNRRGRLIDGQHRLMACIAANKPFETLVVYGLEEKAFIQIDSGKRRGGADVLAISGEVNRCALAATLMHLFKRELGQKPNDGGVTGKVRMTQHDYLRLLRKHPGVRDSVYKAQSEWRTASGLTSPSIAAWLHYEFSLRNQAKADEFFRMFNSGENLAASSPVFQLRKKLIANKTSKARMARPTVIAYVIKAWNYFYKGEACTHLKYHHVAGESNSAEAFPTIEGEIRDEDTNARQDQAGRRHANASRD